MLFARLWHRSRLKQLVLQFTIKMDGATENIGVPRGPEAWQHWLLDFSRRTFLICPPSKGLAS
jgi:hypothetical protein